MDHLSKLRELWYSAYIAGDTSALRVYESPNLRVIVNGEIETGDRYSDIQAKVDLGTWFQPKIERDDTCAKTDSGFIVDGIAKVIEGKAAGKELSYSEVWNYENGSLKISRLTINA